MPDQRERLSDNVETFKTIIEGHMLVVWTAMPGIVQDFDPDDCTATIQVAIKTMSRAKDGTITWADREPLVKVPVSFPTGGGFAVTFGLAKGDEGVIIFCSRCIDQWWLQGGSQQESYLRNHDVQDALFYPGGWSKPNVFSNISANSMQLRNKNGSCLIELTDDTINMKAPNGVNIQGKVNSDSEGTFAGHTVGGHTHVETGSVTEEPQG